MKCIAQIYNCLNYEALCSICEAANNWEALENNQSNSSFGWQSRQGDYPFQICAELLPPLPSSSFYLPVRCLLGFRVVSLFVGGGRGGTRQERWSLSLWLVTGWLTATQFYFCFPCSCFLHFRFEHYLLISFLGSS